MRISDWSSDVCSSDLLVGFSFGGIIGGHVAVLQGERVETLTLVGAGGMQLGRGEVGKLMKWRDLPPAEFAAAQRHNLAVIMFGDPDKIDDLAIWLQGDNTSRGRSEEHTSELQSLMRISY